MLTRRELLTSAVLLPVLPGLLTRVAFGQDTPAPASPSPNAPWLEKIARQIQAEFNLPAVWIAANVKDNVETAVVGVRKFGDPTPATIDDLLLVASISKPMIALWIATLVEQGKLDYDTKVLDVLPELAEVCLPEHQGLVLGQLLTHTAELVRDVKSIPNDLPLEKYPAERIREAKAVLSQPSPHESIDKYLYSNAGVALAATMAERVAGENYEVAATRFYQGLGLKTWGVWPMDLKEDLSLPWPHLLKDKVPIPRSPRTLHHYFTVPSGSAHCSITDLARFGLLATDATEMAHGILRPETWAELSAARPNTPTTYSCFRTSGERFAYVHGGSLRTMRSGLLVLPEWETALAIYTNADSDEFTNRAPDIFQDTFRQLRSAPTRTPKCRLTITNVSVVDTSFKKVITPKLTDDKVRIRVNFLVETTSRTGDLQILVTMGEAQGRSNFYRGLEAGNRSVVVVLETPKTSEVQVTVTLDALGTAGVSTRESTTFASTLTLA